MPQRLADRLTDSIHVSAEQSSMVLKGHQRLQLSTHDVTCCLGPSVLPQCNRIGRRWKIANTIRAIVKRSVRPLNVDGRALTS